MGIGLVMPANGAFEVVGSHTYAAAASSATQAIKVSIVQVFALGAGDNVPVPVGRTVANADGTWRLAVGPLQDGQYALSATVTPPSGSPIVDRALQALTIDTVGPRVQSVRYDRRSGTVTAIFRDERSGLNPSSIAVPRNYNLLGRLTRRIASSRSPAVVSMQVLPTDPLAVSVTLQTGPRARVFRILSGGISDLAGNPLDGENTGHIPSGNGHPGGNYIGVLAPGVATLHARAISPPKGVRALSHRRHSKAY